MKKLFIIFCILFVYTSAYGGSIGLQDLHNWDGDSGESTFTRTTSGGYTITLKDVGMVADILMTHGGGVNYNRATVSAALTTIGTSANVSIVFTPGVWSFTTGITIPSNVTSIFPSGVTLVPSSGVTIWIQGPILAGNYPLFDTSASGSAVTLLDSALVGIRYEAWSGTGNEIYIGAITVNDSGASVFVKGSGDSGATWWAVGSITGENIVRAGIGGVTFEGTTPLNFGEAGVRAWAASSTQLRLKSGQYADVALLSSNNTFGSTVSDGFLLKTASGTLKKPALVPWSNDALTGVGGDGDGRLSLVSGGIEIARSSTTGFSLMPSGVTLFLSEVSGYGIWISETDGKAYIKDSTSTRVIP